MVAGGVAGAGAGDVDGAEPVVLGVRAIPVDGEVAAPVVAGGLVGACATLLLPPQPAHHHTPMPIATSTMMPIIHAPELSSRTRRLSGS